MVNFGEILSNLGVEFDSVSHTYTKNGNIIPSSTYIVNRVMGNPFSQETIYMRRARDKGTLIHNAINKLVLLGEKPSFPMIEVDNFIRLTKEHNIEWSYSEQIIYNDINGMEYAGTLDLFSVKYEEISDVKTGSTKQIKKWQIQLSLYAWALIDKFGLKVTKGSILWLHDEKAEYIPIDILSKDEIIAILKAYYENRDDYNKAEDFSLKTLNPTAIEEFNATLDTIQMLEEKIKGTKEKIKAEMEQRGLSQIRLGQRVISYVASTTRESVDSKKLKEEYPEIWDKCKKVSKVNASIRIK